MDGLKVYEISSFILFILLMYRASRLEDKVRKLEEEKIKTNNHIFGLGQRIRKVEGEIQMLVELHDTNMKIIHKQLDKQTNAINENIRRVNEIHDKTFITLKNN